MPMCVRIPAQTEMLLGVVMEPLPDLSDLIWAFEGEPWYAYEEDDRAARVRVGLA